MSDKNKVGAVMVVGSGIGGCQASLDLADSGFKVYLVDKEPSIGGVMAQLDKTFPTNDCAMCILAPKLVAVDRHPNIELILNADITKLEGQSGNFNVSINKRSRYVHEDKCTGCSDCVQKCPVQFSDGFNQGLNDRKAVYLKFPQAVPFKVLIQKDGIPPCKDACPAHVNCQGYTALISNGSYEEALNLIRERCPLPAAIGRICPHPCEAACNRGDLDEPINICGLKRFVADYVRENIEEELVFLEDKKEEKVAIVGAGPSGLTVAYHLARRGYSVTIFEREEVPGGMLRLTVPNYRLPPEILDADIDHIKKYGVEIKTNSPIGAPGPSVKDLLKDFNAVFIGVGLPNSRKLNIEGEDLEDVLSSIDFLKDCSMGKKVKVGKKVVVIGGGDVAIDAARSALRQGAEEVNLVMLESDDIIPAHSWEVEEAREEGIKFNTSLGPSRIIGEDGKVKGLETLVCSSVFDENGQFNPVFDACSEAVIEGDMIIVAIGQTADLEFLDKDIKVGRGIEIDKNNFQTSMQGVFAGGEIVSGPGAAIDAMASGNKAAIVIEKYLKGEDISNLTELIPDYDKDEIVSIDDLENIDSYPLQGRKENTEISPEERKKDFREFVKGMDEETVLEEAKRCLNCGGCSECFECVKACKAEAIDHDKPDEQISINVGAVILSPGFDEYEPGKDNPYGYGKYPNVITSIEFERILSASGPFEGHVVRPLDHKIPERIAFLQCIGSRDKHTNEYCSSVCCMYTTKEAVIATEHMDKVDITIFSMDIRACGKDFDKYIERAKDQYGIRYIRRRVSAIEEIPDTKDLKIRYETEDGKIVEEIFNLVVLSVGAEPHNSVKGLAETLDIELNEYGFCKTESFTPVETSREGIYVCGMFSEPKDIPETVVEASAAAGCVNTLLYEVRNTLVVEKELPDEIEMDDGPPRIGVFVCHCGINIGGTVNVPEVVEYASTLPDVVYAERNVYTCSADTQTGIKERIKEHNLNRVIVASCTPRTHEPLFQATIREAGLNKYLFDLANIRDQCSWVHMHEPEEATQKAKDLVRMSVAKARNLVPLQELKVEVTHKGMVIGGGISGMTAALNLADQGYEMYLIEKSEKLGGFANHIYQTIENDDVQKHIKNLIEKVNNHKFINVILDAEINLVSGYLGNFKIDLVHGKEKEKMSFNSGIIIAATGANEYKPKDDYGFGQDDRITTQIKLEELLFTNEKKLKGIKSIVMIQCVGSRNEEHPYCSRMCCMEAIKNALLVKKKNPSTEVIVLFRDIRTYGFSEKYYAEAREAGVIFLRFDEDNPPIVKKEGDKLKIEVAMPSKDIINISSDLVVLSTGIVAPQENNDLAKLLKVPLNEDNYFLEAHVKLRPSDFATEGIYLCGTARGNATLSESIAQANSAASRAATILSKDVLATEGVVSYVNEDKCIGCGRCAEICPYNAIELIDYSKQFGLYEDSVKKAHVISVVCKGCGTCFAECPNSAISMKHFGKDQIKPMVEEACEHIEEEEEWNPRIVAFLCNWCSYAGADLAGVSRYQYPPNVRIIRVMCSGGMSRSYILRAFSEGADGVMVSGCHIGDCHYISGNEKAYPRMEHLKTLLGKIGIDEERFRVHQVSASEGGQFAEIITNFTDHIKKLGVSSIIKESKAEKLKIA